MGSFLGSPYRGNTESGRVDHRLQELLVLMLVKIGLCTPFEDIVFGAALSADKPVRLTVSLLALTSAALLKMKGCSSAVEALCGQPKSRIMYTAKGQPMKSPPLQCCGSRRWGVF